MDKAVLVIDMPKACCKCPFFHSDFDIKRGACRANMMELTKDNFYFQKPDECPLKSLPEKCDIEKLAYPETDADFMRGWNACITELMEKENETNAEY